MALIKHVVDGNGVAQDVPMTPEEEAEFLASLPGIPKRVTQILSRRQFYQQLAIAGTITQPEALAAVKTGTVPAALAAFIASLATAEQQFDAEMILSGATEFQRSHPYVAAIAAAQGMTSDQVDDFFIAAGAL